MKRRFASLLLALAICLSLSVPALAAGEEPIGFYADGVVEVEVEGLTPGRVFNMISVVDTAAEPADNLGLGSGTVDENGVLRTSIVTGGIEETNLANCYVYVYSNSNGDVVVSGTLAMASYEITLSLDGGSLPEGTDNPMTCTAGDSVTLPTPTKDGFTFQGWYDGETEVTSPYQPTSDVTLTARWETAAAATPVTGVTLDPASLEIEVGDSATLTATVQPTSATNKTVTWSSNNNAIATVNGGVVTGIAEGTATITVTTVDGSFSDTCTVTVTAAAVQPTVHTITASAGAGGTITPSGPISVANGGSQAFAISAHNHYAIADVVVDGMSRGAIRSYTFENVTGDHTITASFAYVGGGSTGGNTGGSTGGSSSGGSGSGSSSSGRYDVDAAASDHGTVELDPSTAREGDRVIATPIPDDGYVCESITVTDEDGNPVDTVRRSNGSYLFYMPEGDVTVEAVFVLDTTEPTPPTITVGLPFTDISRSAWYYNAVRYVYDAGLMNGTSATTFAPTATLTRSMTAQVLYNLAGTPAAGASNFSDVASGAWYADAVAWASAQGVVTGYGNGTFGPNDPVTREQLAAMLYRYAQSIGASTAAQTDLAGYPDRDSVSDWAYEAMSWAVGAGIITGTDAGALNPLGYASRAEVATILMRTANLF